MIMLAGVRSAVAPAKMSVGVVFPCILVFDSLLSQRRSAVDSAQRMPVLTVWMRRLFFVGVFVSMIAATLPSLLRTMWP